MYSNGRTISLDIEIEIGFLVLVFIYYIGKPTDIGYWYQWWTEPDRTYRIYRTGSVSGSVRSGSVFSSNTKPDFSNEMCP